MESLTLRFSDERTAQAVRVWQLDELPRALVKLGLAAPTPVIAVVGGAGGLRPGKLARLRPLFVRALAPLAQALGAAVVDGGTDAGVMRLMGRARAAVGGTFPLIGVAARETVTLPSSQVPAPRTGSDQQTAPLEPHHTHFVLVPGVSWGDESAWLSEVAGALADGAGSVTVLVNGGAVALKDASHSLRAGRKVIAVGGSGRTADLLAGALRGDAVEALAAELAASGAIRAVHSITDLDALGEEIRGVLLRSARPPRR